MNALRAYRAKAGMSQRALAEKLEISRMTLIRWETGQRKIDAARVPSISLRTGIPARELRPDLVELLG